MKIDNYEDLEKVILKDILPRTVVIDVQGRILDYILGGGDIEDPYIRQQYKYVEKVLRKVKKKQFTQRTLDKLLDEIIEEYFSDDTQKYGLGMWEVIEYVKGEYEEEIATLPR